MVSKKRINKGRVCSARGCTSPAFCKTYCTKHYMRFSKTGDPLKTPSNRPHGQRNICKIKDCNGIVEGWGWCRKHYKKWRKYGDPLMGRAKGIGKYTKEGYVLVRKKDWPTARKDNYILEHRLVMEIHLGRSLNKNEIVHHRNGIRDDNRIENLGLMTTKTHYKGSEHIICPHCSRAFR